MSVKVNYDITFLISDLGSGGSQRVLHRLISHWALSHNGQHPKKMAVITLSSEAGDFYKLPDNVDRYCINAIKKNHNKFSGLLSNVVRIRRLRRIFRKTRPKVVISFICTTNILAVLASIGCSHKLIISERNDPERQSFGRLWDILRKRLYRFSDFITANSEGALKSMASYVPKEKLRWVPNPVNATTSEDRMEFCSPTILAVGRLHHQKAYDILLAAFALFSKEYPAWQLVVLGEGALKNTLIKQAKALGISDRVIWYGRVSDPFPFYRGADIFAMPSRHEGVPNALLEAMSCGLPVVVSDASPGPLEYVAHEENGLVVPTENIEALSQALSRLAASSVLRSTLSKASTITLQAHSFQDALLPWESLLESVKV